MNTTTLSMETMLLIIQIILIITFVMGALMLLWIYTPFSILSKILLTFISTITIYDMFKHFVYTKWLLIREHI
jgi:hypothetical protein